jgi:hypothetical protein
MSWVTTRDKVLLGTAGALMLFGVCTVCAGWYADAGPGGPAAAGTWTSGTTGGGAAGLGNAPIPAIRPAGAASGSRGLVPETAGLVSPGSVPMGSVTAGFTVWRLDPGSAPRTGNGGLAGPGTLVSETGGPLTRVPGRRPPGTAGATRLGAGGPAHPAAGGPIHPGAGGATPAGVGGAPQPPADQPSDAGGPAPGGPAAAGSGIPPVPTPAPDDTGSPAAVPTGAGSKVTSDPARTGTPDSSPS